MDLKNGNNPIGNSIDALNYYYYWPHKKLKCSAGKYFINIDPNGDVYACLVRKEKDQKAYKLKELESILPFMRHQPIELNYKFIIIDEAESISEIALNKLLKTLEEPEIMACFFFLNRSGKKFLQTIKSFFKKTFVYKGLFIACDLLH